MKARNSWWIACALALVTFAAWAPTRTNAMEGGAAPLAITLGPGSVLWLEGTSTVHDFESRSKEVDVEFTRDPGSAQPTNAAALLALIRSSAVRVVVVQVPVRSLRSNKAAIDKNLRRAMRAEEHPNVSFHLKHYAATSRPAANDTVVIEAAGSLTVAGRERPVSLEARAYLTAEGVWLEGNKTLRMSDFGIKPPTMMLGTLKVRDPITVHYRLLLIPKDVGMSSSPHRSN